MRDISVDVRPGELLLVCGPIGSVKSVLHEGLAGTREPLAGECSRLGRSTAYVVQQPWLLNGTVLENIAFGCQYDASKTQQVLESCALVPDLQALSEGLHTHVGEHGVQLSGGQKQRVSLARAVYSGAEVILMDDVMSALDTHVGKHVWEAVICRALAGRARVSVTHQVHYSSHPSVSNILTLNDSGSVKDFVNFEELRGRGVDFGTMLRQWSEHSEDEGAINPDCGIPARSPVGGQLAHASTAERQGVAAVSELRRLGAVDRADFLEYLQACGGCRSVGLIVVLIVAYYGSLLASNFQLAMWANSNVSRPGGGDEMDVEKNKRHLLNYLLLALSTGCSCLLFFLGIQLVYIRSSRVLHRRFAQSLLRVDLRFFDITLARSRTDVSRTSTLWTTPCLLNSVW